VAAAFRLRPVLKFGASVAQLLVVDDLDLAALKAKGFTQAAAL